jgi:hypothetical protein
MSTFGDLLLTLNERNSPGFAIDSVTSYVFSDGTLGPQKEVGAAGGYKGKVVAAATVDVPSAYVRANKQTHYQDVACFTRNTLVIGRPAYDDYAGSPVGWLSGSPDNVTSFTPKSDLPFATLKPIFAACAKLGIEVK